MKPLLTIAIPTYNRPDQLRRSVTAVLPQLTPAVRLRVHDNCSAEPAEGVVRPLLADYPHADVAVFRNPVNVGGSANVLRCIEACETDWVWVVGDDDRLTPDAVARVLADLADHPDTAVFNYASTFHNRPADLTFTGADEFADRLDSLGGLVFISANVLDARRLKPHVALANQFLYTFSSHLVFALCVAADGGVFRLRAAKVVDADLSGYSRLTVVLGFSVLLDLPLLTDRQRRSLAGRVRTTFCSFDRLVSHLVFEARHRRDLGSSLYYFDQLYFRLFYFERNPLRRLKARASRLLVRFPGVGRALLVAALHARYGRAEASRIADERGGVDRLARL